MLFKLLCSIYLESNSFTSIFIGAAPLFGYAPSFNAHALCNSVGFWRVIAAANRKVEESFARSRDREWEKVPECTAYGAGRVSTKPKILVFKLQFSSESVREDQSQLKWPDTSLMRKIRAKWTPSLLQREVKNHSSQVWTIHSHTHTHTRTHSHASY